MLVVETIAKIRREHDRGKPIKAIMREMGLSRNTVRKAIRAESAQFSYRRAARPRPQLGAFAERLDGFLEQNERAAKRDRLRLSRIHDLLQRDGFAGSYVDGAYLGEVDGHGSCPVRSGNGQAAFPP